ncbi:MAG: c-type cytochrome [Acidobacteria bacterium]|nr:c-type cytochrome [Acidobacteriota bacterium]
MARAAAFVALAALLAGLGAVTAVSGVAGAVASGPATHPPATGTTQTPLSVWSGVYTAEQADRGAPLYEVECGECHGPSLEGGETAPALAGADFRWAWNGLSVGDLFERLCVSMPEGRPRALTRAQKVDVLAYMLRENAFPAGDAELPSRGSRLDAIAFEALAP